MAANTGKNKFSELRKRAQAYLAKETGQTEIIQEDVQKLLHELDTYQVELELQNEDIRNAQEELEKSRARYATLYDFAPIAYMTVSDKGMILEANLTAGNKLGVARGQLINRPFSSVVFSDDQDVFYSNRRKLLETGQQQSFEIRLQKNDGSFFYGLAEMVIDSSSCDLPGQFLVMVNNISARKEAELADLRHLKERYRAIVMDQRERISRFDPQGRITFVNDAFCRYYRVEYQDILGTRYLPNIHEEDLHFVKDQLNSLTRRTPDTIIEYRVRMPDGTVSWQQCFARALFDSEGAVVEYQTVSRDVTDLKVAEAGLQNELRMRQLFLDALPCFALLLKNNSWQIIAANKVAMEFGAVPGKTCHETWANDEKPCAWCRAQKLWESGEPQRTQTWVSGQCWDAYWVPVDDERYLYYAFDITEMEIAKQALKKAHDDLEEKVAERTAELQQSHAQLLHSEKLAAVGNLAASIAHEFNNPLQSVMTIVKGLGRYAALEKDEHELVELALQECHRMKNLIADLRDFFLPSSGKRSPVDIHGTIDALLLLSKKEYSTKGVRVVKKYGGNIVPITAVGDQLKQVFLNLLNNAADAIGERGGIITISTEAIGGETVAIHIADTGTGIDAANMQHIFEPFFTTKPDLKGTGLGLSVSYGIVKKHGGRIEVQSEAGKGSIFSVYLPVESIHSEQ